MVFLHQSSQGSYTWLIPFLILLNFSLLLASNLVSYNARLEYYLPVPMAVKMSASKLIVHFSSYPAALGFQSSSPPDNITLNPANRKTDLSLS